VHRRQQSRGGQLTRRFQQKPRKHEKKMSKERVRRSVDRNRVARKSEVQNKQAASESPPCRSILLLQTVNLREKGSLLGGLIRYFGRGPKSTKFKNGQRNRENLGKGDGGGVH